MFCVYSSDELQPSFTESFIFFLFKQSFSVPSKKSANNHSNLRTTLHRSCFPISLYRAFMVILSCSAEP